MAYYQKLTGVQAFGSRVWTPGKTLEFPKVLKWVWKDFNSKKSNAALFTIFFNPKQQVKFLLKTKSLSKGFSQRALLTIRMDYGP